MEVFINVMNDNNLSLVRKIFDLNFLNDVEDVFNNMYKDYDFDNALKVKEIKYIYNLKLNDNNEIMKIKMSLKNNYINYYDYYHYIKYKKTSIPIFEDFAKKVIDIVNHYNYKELIEKDRMYKIDVNYSTYIEKDRDLSFIISYYLPLNEFIKIFDLENLSNKLDFSYEIKTDNYIFENNYGFKIKYENYYKHINIYLIKQNYNLEINYFMDNEFSIRIFRKKDYDKIHILYRDDFKKFNYENEKHLHISVDMNDINYSINDFANLTKTILLSLFISPNQKFSHIKLIKKYFSYYFDSIKIMSVL